MSTDTGVRGRGQPAKNIEQTVHRTAASIITTYCLMKQSRLYLPFIYNNLNRRYHKNIHLKQYYVEKQ